MSKIILVAATSLNGKITHGQQGDSFLWTSAGDQKYFSKLIKSSDLVIMGRQTYLVNRSKFDLTRPPLRLIVTHHPQDFSKFSIPNHLEFTSLSPHQIIDQYSPKHKQILIVGGAQINSLFLKENLVDEIFLTIEPLLFGQGKNLLKKVLLTQKCHLFSLKKISSSGTLLLKYKIIKNEN